MLADGRILLSGGYVLADRPKVCGMACAVPPTATAEIYDPRTRTFQRTGSMKYQRAGHRAVLLHDGRVLVLGSYGSQDPATVGSAEIWDPATGRFTYLGAIDQDTSGDVPSPDSSASPGPAPTMLLTDQSLTVLADGRVLIAGGSDLDFHSSNAVTIFDPATGKFSNLPGMPQPWRDLSASLLPDGRVLLVGGFDNSNPVLPSHALLFDPATGTFSAGGQMAVPRVGVTSIVLKDGRVLLLNGTTDPTAGACGGVLPAELYDPGTGTFSAASGLRPNAYVQAALTPDGGALLLGGVAEDCTATSKIEAFDPDTSTVSVLSGDLLPMETGIHSAFALSDGPVVVLTDGGVTNSIFYLKLLP